ncbi:MAG: hypothetical protein KAT96_00120 [Candidatus Omnitrophica bacterium]|nr:hypothetical protein [Candidatus Omnitrophota bacterium]
MIKKLSAYILRLSKREKFVFFSAIFFVSLIFLDRLVLGPILSKMKLLNKEIQSQESTIKKSLHILAQKDRLKKETNKYASFVVPAQSQEEEMVFFLKDIEELANKCSVYVIDIKSAGLAEEGIFKKYFVRLNCEAQMEQLTELFYKLESSSKMLKIEKYDIKPKTEGSSVVRCTVSISKAVLP